MFFPRLGLFRLILSLAVLSFHAWPAVFPQSGTVAVPLFFFISGYLISALLDDTYRGRPRDFILNRILRIYPAYYAAAGIGLLTVALLPDLARAANSAFRLDDSLSEILATLTIFGLGGMRLVPPAWSLDTELCWYVILFLLRFFQPPVRLRVLAVFLVLPWLLISAGEPFYGTVLGSGFAFALGAIRYELRAVMAKTPVPLEWLCLAGTLILMFVVPPIIHTTGARGMLPLASPYLFFVSFGVLVGGVRPSRALSWIGYYGGIYSYPIFLVHWSAIVLVLYCGYANNTASYWAAVLATTLAIATPIVFTVEFPLRRIRTGIRGATRRPAAAGLAHLPAVRRPTRRPSAPS